jgi:hypothetical protein
MAQVTNLGSLRVQCWLAKQPESANVPIEVGSHGATKCESGQTGLSELRQRFDRLRSAFSESMSDSQDEPSSCSDSDSHPSLAPSLDSRASPANALASSRSIEGQQEVTELEQGGNEAGSHEAIKSELKQLYRSVLRQQFGRLQSPSSHSISDSQDEPSPRSDSQPSMSLLDRPKDTSAGETTAGCLAYTTTTAHP